LSLFSIGHSIDNAMTKRKKTDNAMTNRKKTDNAMTKRKNTDNAVALSFFFWS
jgi:hypothetical protein